MCFRSCMTRRKTNHEELITREGTEEKQRTAHGVEWRSPGLGVDGDDAPRAAALRSGELSLQSSIEEACARISAAEAAIEARRSTVND